MGKWNYYFEPSKAVSVGGAVVDLPSGHGIVTAGEDAVSEHIFFPAG